VQCGLLNRRQLADQHRQSTVAENAHVDLVAEGLAKLCGPLSTSLG